MRGAYRRFRKLQAYADAGQAGAGWLQQEARRELERAFAPWRASVRFSRPKWIPGIGASMEWRPSVKRDASHGRSIVVLSMAIAVAVVATVVAPVSAQDGEGDPPPTSQPVEETTTTTNATTTTTSTSSPPSTAPPPTTGPDAGPGTPSTAPRSTELEEPTEPPPTVPALPTTADENIPHNPTGVPPQLPQRDIFVRVAEPHVSATDVADARTRVDDLTSRVKDLNRALAALNIAEQKAVAKLNGAREVFHASVTAAFVRGNSAELETLVATLEMISDPSKAPDVAYRNVFMDAIAAKDAQALADFQAARDAVGAKLLATNDEANSARSQLRTAKTDLAEARKRFEEHKIRVQASASGGSIVTDSFVFPVAEPYNFVDSWGYPRMPGSEFAHAHQGTDIMAPFGVELYAVESGVITRTGTDTLGGIKLWLRGHSGTHYYYAHIQSYASGIASGVGVEAGDVIGYNGDSGNARGGAPHLHFQVHPAGGGPVNPYRLLKVVSDEARIPIPDRDEV